MNRAKVRRLFGAIPVLLLQASCLNGGGPGGLSFKTLLPLSGGIEVQSAAALSTLSLQASATAVSNTGGIPETAFTFEVEAAGRFDLRLNGTGCSDGSVLQSGIANEGQTTLPAIPAGSFALGANPVWLCFYAANGPSEVKETLIIDRDDAAPLLSVTPGSGNYGLSIPSISVACNDSGSSGCVRTAFTLDGSLPAFDASGAVSTGNEVTGPIALSDGIQTTLKMRARDRAGNVSAMASETFTVDTTVANISIDTVSNASLNSIGSSTITWRASRAGSYSIEVGGTGCSTGTVIVASTAFTSNTPIATLIPGSSLAAGANTVRICIPNLVGAYASTTFTLTSDSVRPTITNMVAAPGSTGVDPDNTTILLTFSENMDPTLFPTVALKASGLTLDANGLKFSWLSGTSLKIDTNFRLPELTPIYWYFTDSDLKDPAGNSLQGNGTNIQEASFVTALKDRAFLITDTEQTTCSDSAGSARSCNGTGEDGEFLDLPASMNLTVPSILDAAFPADIVTLDGNSNLIWKTCTIGQTWDGNTCTSSGTDVDWIAALNACAALNSQNAGLGYAGRKDWRLPGITEWHTILIHPRSNCAVPGSGGCSPVYPYFPGFQQSSGQNFLYWSGTNNNLSAASAYSLHTFNGKIQSGSKSNLTAYKAICVAGP